MGTCIPVRGLSVLPLLAIILGAFACSGSPSQPSPLKDSTILSESRTFDVDQIPDDSELSSEEEGMLISEDGDAAEGDAAEVDQIDLDALGIRTATASGTIVVSGVVRDKANRAWTISGVTVKATGIAAVRTDASGRFSLRTRPGTITITFAKSGYRTFPVRKLVSRATTVDASLTAIIPSGMTVRCKNRSWMAAKTETGACAGRGGVAYWVVKPPGGAALSSVSLNNNNVPVGTLVNGTVTLNNPAPSGGAKVLLSSTSPATAKVLSSSVTIPAGQKTAAFKVDADAAGSTSITATYANTTKSATLTVTGPPPPPNVVARFEYRPGQCEVVPEPGGFNLIVKCTFDASDSTAPPGSTFRWTFPGNGNVFISTSRTLSNPVLSCGSLPNGGVFERTVTLTVTAQSGATSSVPLPVTFTKSGLC